MIPWKELNAGRFLTPSLTDFIPTRLLADVDIFASTE